MLRYLLPCVALVCGGASLAQAEVKASKLVLPSGVKFVGQGSAYPGSPTAYKFLLANGLRVLVLPDDRNPVAMFRLILDAGSNREQKGATGLAHFFEHMMFRKAKATEEGHYDRTLAGVGGNGNAGTSTDYVVYYASFPGPALDKMLEVEKQRFVDLELKDPYFSTEKGAVISERFMRLENNPEQRGSEIIRSVVEAGTPYEWMVIGAKDDVKNMSLATAQKFYEEFYTPTNAILSVGGPFDASTAIAKINKEFGGWSGKSKPVPSLYSADYFSRNEGKKFVCSELVAENKYQLNYPSKNTTYNDNMMAQVFTQLLDSHPEGVFSRRLLKAKLASQFYFYKNNSMKQNQPLVVYLALNKDQKIDNTIAFWNDAVKWVLTRPIDAKFKQRLIKQTDVSQADLAQKMSSLLEEYEWNEFLFGNYLSAKNDREFIARLNTASFGKWVRENLVNVKPYLTGVVSKDPSVKPCAEFKLADAQKLEVTHAK